MLYCAPPSASTDATVHVAVLSTLSSGPSTADVQSVDRSLPLAAKVARCPSKVKVMVPASVPEDAPTDRLTCLSTWLAVLGSSPLGHISAHAQAERGKR